MKPPTIYKISDRAPEFPCWLWSLLENEWQQREHLIGDVDTLHDFTHWCHSDRRPTVTPERHERRILTMDNEHSPEGEKYNRDMARFRDPQAWSAGATPERGKAPLWPKPAPIPSDAEVAAAVKRLEAECFPDEKHRCGTMAAAIRTVLAALKHQHQCLERLHPYGREEIAELQAKLAAAQRDRERLIELLSASSKYVPAGALYGDILNKPVSETNLLGQIRAAMQEARR